MASHELTTRRKAVMGSSPLFYKEPIQLVRGEGVYLYDSDDQQYLDCYNNVAGVGHSHPHVVAAMHSQASRLNTHSRYLHEGVVAYGERLMALHAEPLTMLQMCCSGTEAIDVAINMARLHTRGRGIICSNATYHGNSQEIIRMTIGPFEPDYRVVHYPDTYRPLTNGLTEAELCDAYLAEIGEAIAGFEADGVGFAGLLFCSIFANEGLPNVPAGYLAKAAALVRAAGGVVIFDEVQAGFGRTGTWWGYEVMGAEPDIVAMGKPMGSGYPLSGVGASPEVAAAFHKRSGYFNTTAGTPVQAAVGSAVIDVIENENLLDRVNEVGAYLRGELSTFEDRYESVGQVRGHGMFFAIDLVSDREQRTPDRALAEDLVERINDKGCLLSNAGEHNNTLKIRPPLVFEKHHAEHLLTVLTECMDQAGA